MKHKPRSRTFMMTYTPSHVISMRDCVILVRSLQENEVDVAEKASLINCQQSLSSEDPSLFAQTKISSIYLEVLFGQIGQLLMI
jgi:hypothetical protein